MASPLLEVTTGWTTLEQAKPDVEKFCYVISGRVRCSIGQELHELKTSTNSAKVLCIAVPPFRSGY